MKKWIDRHLKGIFVTPSIIFILLMIIVPLAYNFIMSFTDWQMSIVKAPKFIGLTNYIDILKDERFRNSVWRTIVFSGVAILLESVLGVALAVAGAVAAAYIDTGLLRKAFGLYLLWAGVSVLWPKKKKNSAEE